MLFFLQYNINFFLLIRIIISNKQCLFLQAPLVEPPTTPTPDSFGGGEKSSSPLSNSQSATDSNILNTNSNSESSVSDYGGIPGAEPTPPPDPSPDYPKIRIKTTGLLKDPEEGLTITEITDENPDGDPNFSEYLLCD